MGFSHCRFHLSWKPDPVARRQHLCRFLSARPKTTAQLQTVSVTAKDLGRNPLAFRSEEATPIVFQKWLAHERYEPLPDRSAKSSPDRRTVHIEVVRLKLTCMNIAKHDQSTPRATLPNRFQCQKYTATGFSPRKIKRSGVVQKGAESQDLL